jgi:hypothetical protein
MSSVSFISGFSNIIIFRRDILKILKKKNFPELASEKDKYALLLSFGFEKKIDKYPIFSTKNLAKELANS